VPFDKVDDVTVTVDEVLRQTDEAAVLKLETSGRALTVIEAVLPEPGAELHVVDVLATEVMVIVVDPEFERVGVENVPVPEVSVSDAVRPVAVLAPLRS